MKNIAIGAAMLLCITYSFCPAQTPADSTHITPVATLGKISDHTLNVLNNRYSRLQKLVEKRAEKAMRRMEKKELDLQIRMVAGLHGIDSIKAAALFAGTRAKYQQLLAQLRSGMSSSTGTASGSAVNPLKEYLPGVDSMQTTLRFLSQPDMANPQQLEKIQALNSQLQQLQGSLQNANIIQNYFAQRQQQIQTQLSGIVSSKQLLGMNQEAYYYQTQLSQYKAMLNDPDKIQQAVLSAVRNSSYFNSFWQKNSYWSALFPTPPAGQTVIQAVAGLQTREALQQDVQRRLGMSVSKVTAKAEASGGGGGGVGYLQNQLQNAQNQLAAVKQRLGQLGGGGTGGSTTLPDFQPNSQHNHTFLQRLDYSVNIQNTASTALLPAISTMGLNIGYKFSDKAVAGVGGSYLLGLGYGLDHIRFTNQGIGYRVFGDIKAKGSVWISGGLERTYLQQFSGLQNIRDINAWQSSALAGLTKKYRIGKKSGELQLLYNFLATQSTSVRPFVFRMGWSL